MAQELSSNWKKLQAKIKAESTTSTTSAGASSTTTTTTATKRKKANGSNTAQPQPPKKQKLGSHQVSSQSTSRHPKSVVRNTTSKKPGPPMGNTQSSAPVKGTAATITPSLALWAEDNDISPEDLAEAYNLGGSKPGRRTGGTPAILTTERHRINEGLAPGVDVGKYIALDCEMVGVGPDGQDHALARASLVDFHGRQVYDSFVRPRSRVTDFRTHITGITASTLHPNSGPREFAEVQRTIADLLRGRIVVGHDIRHDLAVLELNHPTPMVRDTARFSGYRRYGHGPKPALRVLAREVLGLEDFQTGAHSSIEDARVAMLLFRRRKSEFDVEHANKYGVPSADEAPRRGAGAGVGDGAKGKGELKKGKGPNGGKKKKKKR
ncbi:Uu.00g052580.m01.CDS01 [Anthostomella pinea]|uniref:RNA exonuclease 4 n=1 Tax=Anthostomella pinea TaxID=933095 RepID=A0AAI8YPE8_9PEZI|nr:Uu.00g052580.m01.CDS01 [Anthostomella pinea]